MKIQQPFEFTNNENRFLSFEMASNLYLIGFSQTPFFWNKNQKSTPNESREKHHPWSLGFLALISGKVDLFKADKNWGDSQALFLKVRLKTIAVQS